MWLSPLTSHPGKHRSPPLERNRTFLRHNKINRVPRVVEESAGEAVSPRRQRDELGAPAHLLREKTVYRQSGRKPPPEKSCWIVTQTQSHSGSPSVTATVRHTSILSRERCPARAEVPHLPAFGGSCVSHDL